MDKKVCIVSTLISEKEFEGPILDLRDEFEQNGINCSLLRYGEFKVEIEDDIRLYLRGKFFNPSLYSLFIFKLGFRNPTRGDLYLLDFLEKFNIPYFNKINPYLIAKSKITSRILLKRSGIPVPETFLFRRFEEIDGLGVNFPVIVKPDIGSKGKEIYFCMNKTSLKKIFEKMWNEDRNRILLVERFYKTKGENHQDIRVFVLGGKVIGGMKRVAKDGDFRSNYSLGGKVYPQKLSEEVKEIAVSSTKILGLYMAGVDIIETEEGYKVLEVNGNPGIEGISLVNRDFFKKFVDKVKRDFFL